MAAVLRLVGFTLAIAAQAAPQELWSLIPPRRTEPPPVRDAGWVRNPIDQFVLATLERQGLTPNASADRATLCRRLYLDLTGLPPTVEQLDRWLADASPNAYEDLVDTLLASPHYGERMARSWLDLARYADTNGYEKDRPRSAWPWRDWVIRAFCRDLPFDQFTVEQLAGDLLPEATLEQRLATGFHRNTMLNEEGGIDAEEYRYHSVVDRTNTTATVWLGMTLACAQCHDHKYDPLTQHDYFRMLAFFDNQDEPMVPLPDAGIAAQRQQQLLAIDQLERTLGQRFPVPPDVDWLPLRVVASAEGGTTLTVLDDQSVLAGGANSPTQRYVLTADVPAGTWEAVRLEALVDPAQADAGPGRTAHGNFVLNEIELELDAQGIAFIGAEADYAQPGWPVAGAIDGLRNTGWAVDERGGNTHQNRSATFSFAPKTLTAAAPAQLVIEQAYGGQHTLLRFRVSLGRTRGSADREQRRAALLAERLSAWTAARANDARPWQILRPTLVRSAKGASLTVLADGSVLASGDRPQTDEYVVEARADAAAITGIRLEALLDPSLPEGGPGRADFYQDGDFLLSEVTASVAPRDADVWTDLTFRSATAGYEPKDRPAAATIDGVAETGWSVQGRVGEAHGIVFELAESWLAAAAPRLRLTLCQHGIHQMTLGRFRVAVTTAGGPLAAAGVPAEVETILVKPASERTPAERTALETAFLRTAPELAPARAEITKLRHQLPRFATAMVLEERPPQHARTTFLRRRGDFLRPVEPVEPSVPACLPPLPAGTAPDRLGLARWLVDAQHPLTARVTVNRLWSQAFGRGLVETGDDFGRRGAPPSHPELLDWLATEFVRQGWSVKGMLRLLVTSATYRQAAAAPAAAWSHDPDNVWLARSARWRVDAETTRDLALQAAGLLDPRLFGASVFPPQPDGVTDVAYGGFSWKVSQGADRWRRGLYTFQKRAAPYAAFATFDAPSGETCCPRRPRSSSPLQALTLLNDPVFTEAAQALAKRALEVATDDHRRLDYVLRACTARSPATDEQQAWLGFLATQRARLDAQELDAAKLAGDAGGFVAEELAAWTALCRVAMNLDETMTRD